VSKSGGKAEAKAGEGGEGGEGGAGAAGAAGEAGEAGEGEAVFFFCIVAHRLEHCDCLGLLERFWGK